jgi:periplasmic protein TonB
MAYAGPHIETLDMHHVAAGAGPRRVWIAPASLGLHLTGVVALVLVPLLTTSVLPEPAAGVRAFFVEPVDLAPPPPPPPPPPAASAAKVAVSAVPAEASAATFTAPVEVPDEVRPEDSLDLGGIEGGVPGGVEGGIPGGVIGGIVGGLPAAAPPPPPAPVTLRVGGDVKEPRKIKHVEPVYPDLAAKARLEGVIILEAIIAPNGQIRDVKVLRGAPLLDEAALAAVRQWAYTPTLLNGVPVQVALVVTVRFRITQPVSG